jgi:mannose-6-phosphate isomerase-like protein (cupin superfamily)
MVLDGPVEMFVGEDHRILHANECYFIPARERHGWKTFDKPVTLLDISSKRP